MDKNQKLDDEKLSLLSQEFFQKVGKDDQLQELLKEFDNQRMQHHPHTFYSHAFEEGVFTKEDIAKAHEQIPVNEEHFDSMLNHFVQSLNNHGMDKAEQSKALEILNGFKQDVIGESKK